MWSATDIILQMYASYTLFKPLPPSFRQTYRRSTSPFLWNDPLIVSCFLVATSRSCISSFDQSRIANVGVKTGTANMLWACALFLPHNSLFQIFLTRDRYSVLTRCFVISPQYLTSSSMPRYLYGSSLDNSESCSPFIWSLSPSDLTLPFKMLR